MFVRCCNHHPTPLPAPAVLASTVIVEVAPTPLPARIVSPPPWAATKAIDILRTTVSCSSHCDSHVKSRIQFTDNKVENNKSDKEPDVLAEELQVS
ncbi:hypothetical protein BS78_09G146600 [Paspalum vaginatum]|nr:hypothetical protein BS78_09G146600 [Paspalum vaginatum]